MYTDLLFSACVLQGGERAAETETEIELAGRWGETRATHEIVTQGQLISEMVSTFTIKYVYNDNNHDNNPSSKVALL
jgi:hypothetical protein